MSDETFDLLCRVCRRKGHNTEAEKYCVECQDYYCLTCVQVHEDVPLLTGHNILDKDCFSTGSMKSRPFVHPLSNEPLPVAPTERCDRHTHHYIDMYCLNHDDVGCGTCMTIDHRLCKDTFYLPEFLLINTCNTATREIQQKLESVAKVLTEHQEKFKQIRERLLQSKTATLKNIKKFRKEINDRFDELEKNTVSYIGDKYKAFINEIEEGIRILETSKSRVKSARDKLTSTSDNKLQNFVNIKKGKSIAVNAAKSVEVNQLQTPLKDIEFTADHRLASLLEEINVFGKLEPWRISLSSKMTSTNKIKTGFECRGLSYADGNLYISDNDTSVYVYSLSGKRLMQFSKDQFGQKLFSDIRRLAVSEDCSKIHVADRNNGLITLDDNGTVVGRFNGSQLEGAKGCYLTVRGSLLVCGCDSGNVLQFGLDGILKGEVLEFGDIFASYQAVCCNQQTSKMIIGTDRNEIEVYDLI